MSRLVLVIDDDPVERAVIGRILDGAGHRVLAAADGAAGLDLAAQSRPDLVILDVMMPRLNGYQACRALKRDPATAGCPILILTARGEAPDQVWAREVGADGFLAKPVDPARLLQTVADLTAPR